MTKIEDESVPELADSASSESSGGAFDTKLQKAINLLLSCGWSLERAQPGFLVFRKYVRQSTHEVSVGIRPKENHDNTNSPHIQF